jgi:AcrR family transcriptional regulator
MAGIREKQLQKRKRETIDVAMRILSERGYANLNMDELAEEVGISKPTLYQYFNSKDELVAQVLLNVFMKMEDRLAEAAEKSPLGQLEHFLRLMLKSRSEGRHILAQVDDELRRTIFQRYAYLREQMQANRDKLGQIVRTAQEQGEIDPALPAWVVVNSLFALQGAVMHPLMKGEAQRSSEEMSEAIEGVIRIFRRGVAGEKLTKSSDA